MTRDEYLAVLDQAPATPNQVGAIQHEAARLGLDDRAERLAVCARLLDLDELGSTRDLSQGQAGKLVGILRRIRDRAELAEIITSAGDAEQDDEHQDDERDDGDRLITWPEAIARFVVLLYVAWQEKQLGTGQAELANIGLNVKQLRATGGFTSAPDDSARTREEGDSP